MFMTLNDALHHFLVFLYHLSPSPTSYHIYLGHEGIEQDEFAKLFLLGGDDLMMYGVQGVVCPVRCGDVWRGAAISNICARHS